MYGTLWNVSALHSMTGARARKKASAARSCAALGMPPPLLPLPLSLAS